MELITPYIITNSPHSTTTTLQTHIRKNTLGDRWNTIITHHEDHHVFADLKVKEKSGLKAREGLTDEMVRQRMGKAR